MKPLFWVFIIANCCSLVLNQGVEDERVQNDTLNANVQPSRGTFLTKLESTLGPVETTSRPQEEEDCDCMPTDMCSSRTTPQITLRLDSSVPCGDDLLSICCPKVPTDSVTVNGSNTNPGGRNGANSEYSAEFGMKFLLLLCAAVVWCNASGNEIDSLVEQLKAVAKNPKSEIAHHLKSFIKNISALLPLAEDPTLKLRIDEIFPPPLEAPSSELSENCECVIYSLCKDGVSNVDSAPTIDLRFGTDNPCSDVYEKPCCEKTEKPIKPANRTLNAYTGHCGSNNPNTVIRAVNKHMNEAHYAEFPWTVIVFQQDKPNRNFSYKCGGSLIHPQAVLTAAHCVSSVGSTFKIRAGEWDINSSSDEEFYPLQDRQVKHTIIHEEFDEEAAAINDVALLIFDTPVVISANVGIICLPEQDQFLDAENCIASGWGRDFNESANRDILKKVELPIIAHEKCQRNLRITRLGSSFKLDKSFICAGGEPGKDTCRGDGGSPLVCPMPGDSGIYYQAGIVAWGISCGLPDVPGVYVNVPRFVDWINHKLAEFGIKIDNNN